MAYYCCSDKKWQKWGNISDAHINKWLISLLLTYQVFIITWTYQLSACQDHYNYNEMSHKRHSDKNTED